MSQQLSSLDPLFLSFQLALAGRYSIEREIGRGGMGVVYLAKEVHLDRPVAIKLLPPDRASDPALRERFLREARMAAKLSHPNIVPIFSVDESTSFVFYVMAFVDGLTLAERVHQRGPLSATEGSRVIREIAWALAHAHGNGLVHRDVKPDNILLEGESGRVLVTDFGIAAALSDAQSAGVSGTPEFMSPEQALGKELDARSDIYSLGATAYYALSGRLPFTGRTTTEILAKHVTARAERLGSLGLPVPRRLAALVDRCLAKSPDDRPVSATVLAEQLGAAMEQRRELPAALRAFVKRNGRLSGAGTIISLIGVLAGTQWIGQVVGREAAWVALGAGMLTIPIVGLAQRARRLLKMGFTHEDVVPAFKQELDLVREEDAIEHGVARTDAEIVLSRVTKTLAVATVWLPGFSLLIVGNWGGWGLYTELFIGGLASLSGLGWLLAIQQRRDIDTEFWARLWAGRVGAITFSIARRLLPAHLHTPTMTHRPTELSLGLAAAELFQSLPKETRGALGDIPKVVNRLEKDAQMLRRRYDEIQDAIVNTGAADESAAVAALAAERDQYRAKLTETIGALETIRLNLLRLHAGSGDVAGFTTHVGIARDLSTDIERLVAGQAEVAALLRPFPRWVAVTPV